MILLKTSPTPMGLKPGFLLSGMSREARNPSSEVDSSWVQSFLVTLASVWQRSEDESLKFFDNKIRFQPSEHLNQRDQILPLFSWLLSLLFRHRSLQTLLGVFFSECLITLRFHEHLLGLDVSVWESSMFRRCSGVIFRFSYSRLACRPLFTKYAHCKPLYQFVIFKPLSYCFEETIGFDVNVSFASRPVSRLIKWYNKPGDITKEFW